jgi:hypothetical protein
VVYISEGLNSQTFDVPAEPVVMQQKGYQYEPHVMGQSDAEGCERGPHDAQHSSHALVFPVLELASYLVEQNRSNHYQSTEQRAGSRCSA